MVNFESARTPSLLVLSDLPGDESLADFCAMTNGLRTVKAHSPDALRHALNQENPRVIFWDADSQEMALAQLGILREARVSPNRIFAWSEDDFVHSKFWKPFFNNCLKTGVGLPFSHHIWRRNVEPLPFLLSRMVGMSAGSGGEDSAPVRPSPSALTQLFPDHCWKQALPIQKTSHRSVAVRALEKVLGEKQVTKRLASLVANATDELLLNAIYEAPVMMRNDGDIKREFRYQKVFDRSKEMPLKDRERVVLELATTDQYLGVLVRDQWGSMPAQVLSGLFDFEGEDTQPDPRRPARHGLTSIVGSGISLRVHTVPGQLTEVALFIPTGGTFKEFRGGMRFLSLQCD